ncbi:MAG: ATP-binding protein [Desulfobacteraceae bacterium]|nr:ATP-binding protein [Desulfobacteraceae bacterium]MBC2718438.1 ATP-binding protein [Desulfobacteraceae bacterium]
MEKRKLKELIIAHTNSALKKHNLLLRQIPNLSTLIEKKEVLVISGVRRCGKSSLMRILVHELIHQKEVPIANVLYFNFEDERLVEFTYRDFETLYESYLELNNPKGKKYLFFDEIQNIHYWEKWINRLYEFEEVKIFITGSSATLLSGEIATALTGRNIPLSLYPFSFKELLTTNNVVYGSRSLYEREVRVMIKRHFDTFGEIGGFPEAALTNDTTILQHYFNDILYRDILTRHSIKNIKQIKELALYLATNIGNLCSYRNLANMISAKSTNTIKYFMEYLENAYLFFRVNLFDYSLKKQIYNPSKIYCVDTALARSISFKFSLDTGRIYENIVFIELLRQGKEVYYWKSPHNYEIDFVVKKGTKITELIQVCADISEKKTHAREIRGVLEAASEFNLKEAIIITRDFAGKTIEDGMEITFLPIWKWLIS